MKRLMKRVVKICTFMVTLLFVVNCGIPAQAVGSVSYVDNASKFIFLPGSDYSPTDLFSELKSVMPGDVIAQEIQIRNDISHKTKIKVYMRASGIQENTDGFLSQMNLTVQQRGDSILFDAPANETAQLTDWVYLGTIYSGGMINLDVKLEVPITMGNDYQNQLGYIDWEFKVDELPIAPTDPQPPKTGDSSLVVYYAGIMFASLIALILLLFFHKRKIQRKDVKQV